jgi:DNA (cytosine-5)-methyltransferase 1
VRKDAHGQGWLTEEFDALEELVDTLKPYTGREIVVDLFCGGGGASEGIRQALGRGPDAAVNHKRDAIAMHAINHPETVHYLSDIRVVDPFEVAAGRPVGLLWASPDCTFFSKARGSKPVRKDIRDLPWVVVKWAQTVRPRVICLENVEEIVDWGPLVKAQRFSKKTGKVETVEVPDPSKKGETWRQWVAALNRCGYVVEKRELRGCNYGVPTLRKRLFVVARCDSRPIRWPEPTHNKNGTDGLRKWRSAAECIDWSIPTVSIFERAKHGRPELVPATKRRIAKGLDIHILRKANPFIVPNTHQGDSRVYDIDDPFRTVTAANRGEWSVVVPTFVGCGGRAGCSPPRAADEPAATVTTKPDTLLVEADLAPYMVVNTTGHPGSSVEDPLSTVTTGNHHYVVMAEMTPFVVGYHRRDDCIYGVEDPLRTQDASNRYAIVEAETLPFGIPRYGERPGQEPRTHSLEEPATTVVPTGNGLTLATVRVSAFMTQYNTGVIGHGMEEPASTICATGSHQALVEIALAHLDVARNHAWGRDLGDPTATVCADGNHHWLVTTHTDAPGVPDETATTVKIDRVLAFLIQYNGTGLAFGADQPLRTITTKDRFGVVTVYAATTVNGQDRIIVDVRTRMLEPRELYRAQGFDDSYIIDPILDGKPLIKSAQTRMCGNSVNPAVAAAIVRENYLEDLEVAA